MIRHITIAALAGAAVFTVAAGAQDKPALSRMVAELRQSLAQNQAQLRKLSWTETREISLKGEVKKVVSRRHTPRQPGETVSLKAAFNSLPSGVSYIENSLLNATAEEIQIRTTNFGHHQ